MPPPPTTPGGAAHMRAPDAATFDDTIDYPLATPANMGRAIALSMLRGSVGSFAQRHRFVQKTAGRPVGWLEEFAGDVYRFARVKGFNQDEAAEVREGMRQKYGTEEEGENKSAPGSINMGKSTGTVGQKSHSTPTPRPSAPDATVLEKSKVRSASVSSGTGKKKRKREKENHVDGSLRKSRKLKSLVDGDQDADRPLKRRKSNKALRVEAPREPSSSPEPDAGRRSRSTSLGELGPGEDSPLQPRAISRHPLSYSKVAGSDVGVDEVPRPVFTVEVGEKNQPTMRETESSETQSTSATDMVDDGGHREHPEVDDHSDEEIILSEDDSESDIVDEAGDALDAERASGALHLSSPFSDGSDSDREDQRPSFAVDWGSSAPVPDPKPIPAADSRQTPVIPRNATSSVDVRQPEVVTKKISEPSPVKGRPLEQDASKAHPDGHGDRMNLERDEASGGLKKRKREPGNARRTSEVQRTPSDAARAPVASSPGAGVQAERVTEPRKLKRFNVGGNSTIRHSLKPHDREPSMPRASASTESTKERQLKRFDTGVNGKIPQASSRPTAPETRVAHAFAPMEGNQLRKARKKAEKLEHRRLEREKKMQAKERFESVLGRPEESIPADLERTSTHGPQSLSRRDSLDEPMPKDLERVFLQAVEITPASPLQHEYHDRAVQTSPIRFPVSAPTKMPVVSQSSAPSRPSQQPSPTETHSNDSVHNIPSNTRASAHSITHQGLPVTPRTPPTSAPPEAQPRVTGTEKPRTTTGKLKRLKFTDPAPVQTFELGRNVRRHKPHRSDDWSVAETEPNVTPAKIVGREIPETLEDEPYSSPELGSMPLRNDSQPQGDDNMDIDPVSVAISDDDDRESPSPQVWDSQRVVPESYAYVEVATRPPERSQMGMGIFDRSDDVLDALSGDSESETSDEESDDDIPHHISPDRDIGPDREENPDRDIHFGKDSGDLESDADEVDMNASTNEVDRPLSLASSSGTDDEQDLINSQLQEEINYEFSQRQSQGHPATGSRKRGEMATATAKRTNATSPRRQTGALSEHFPPSPKKEPKSGLPFPSVGAETFGLFQERYAAQPFKLLVATMFVNQTKGKRALPVVEQLMQTYPTVEQLADADASHVEADIKHLGLGAQRAERLVKLAQAWNSQPPIVGMRYKIKEADYPSRAASKNSIQPGVKFVDSDAEDCGAYLEIAHLPGCGRYAFDSWRIFCRDVFRGVADGWNGEGVSERASGDGTFQPEWMRVLPSDKELRAYLRWMWLKEGFLWDWHTGEKIPADRKLLRLAQEGGPSVERAILTRFKGKRRSMGAIADDESGDFLETPAKRMASATAPSSGRVRRPIFSDLLTDDIEDEEADEEGEGNERSSESVKPPSTTPMRRLGVNGRAMFSLLTYGKRRAQ